MFHARMTATRTSNCHAWAGRVRLLDFTTQSMQNDDLKRQVRDFWDAGSCGEVYAVGNSRQAQYEAQRAARYTLEPYPPGFARFSDGAGRDVLEIGVGMGADHVEWAQSRPRSLTGIDLTARAIAHTRTRMADSGHDSGLMVADAENLPFASDSFDLVYSWGVLHHSPDTVKAFEEVRRVTRAGGLVRVMIYHRYSVVGFLLWIRHALLTGHPLLTLSDIYARHLESPGTKAFTREEARSLCAGLTSVRIQSCLSFGDLLEGEVGQRHRGSMLRVAKRLWPRWLIRRVIPRHGLLLLIEGVKPPAAVCQASPALDPRIDDTRVRRT